jgi:hypothetical protein
MSGRKRGLKDVRFETTEAMPKRATANVEQELGLAPEHTCSDDS